MPDGYDVNYLLVIKDCIHDTIIANSNAPQVVLTLDLAAASRARFLSERLDFG